MTTATPKPAADGLSFGPFHLVASERLLTRNGIPVELGSRTFDMLLVLVSAPNEVVSKQKLLARVWPDVAVEEGSLRFHVAGLRKALGDGKRGARYIKTLSGRGYCFVAPVTRDFDNVVPGPPLEFQHANLPGRLGRMLGRDEDVVKLARQLDTSRFVTVVGAGGVGKSTVAIAVGHHLIDAFAGAVLFVDFGMLTDPALVPTAVASMLSLAVQSDDATPNLIAYLRNRRVLLIFDTCEHLVEAVASLAEDIIGVAPHVHILATSREALRVEGEQIYRLDTLACPPEDPELTVKDIQGFSAVQLFVERAAATGARLDVGEAEARVIGSICRRLDGVALAIELAARRVEFYGLEQTAALLDQRLTLLWLGSRTAPPRQKTLQATLDWSFGLLTELERTVLRRLAIFVGHFTLDAALEVVHSPTLDRSTVFSAIDSLVAKSMIATRPVGAMMRYRLLDTTRAYVGDINLAVAEERGVALRHAEYYRRWLDQTGIEWPELSSGEERIPHFAALNNVRAALEWCFGPAGDRKMGAGLAAAAAPVFLAMSLLPECHRWSERAIETLSDGGREGLDEMHLQAGLGVSLMFMRGGHKAAREALERSFAIAELRGSALDQVRLLGPLNMLHLRTGNFATALRYARQCSAAAATIEDSVAIALAHSILGISLHLGGKLEAAHAELEAAIDGELRSKRTTTTAWLGFEARILAKAILARNLWLQGFPEQALQCARVAVEEASAMDHSLTIAISLIWAVTVLLWTGEIGNAEAYTNMLVERAEAHAFVPYLLVGQGFRSEIAIRRGNAEEGVSGLRHSLQNLHAAPYELLTPELNLSLAKGLSQIGSVKEAVLLVDESIERAAANGNLLHVPELFRVKGTLLLLPPVSDREGAEACFLRAVGLSRGQGARAWELRAATELAKLYASRGEIEAAHALLQPLVEVFGEGSGTSDLKAARAQLIAPN